MANVKFLSEILDSLENIQIKLTHTRPRLEFTDYDNYWSALNEIAMLKGSIRAVIDMNPAE